MNIIGIIVGEPLDGSKIIGEPQCKNGKHDKNGIQENSDGYVKDEQAGRRWQGITQSPTLHTRTLLCRKRARQRVVHAFIEPITRTRDSAQQ